MEVIERVWDSGVRLSKKLSTSGMEEIALNSGSSGSRRRVDEDEEALIWAALEKLPTYDRLRSSVMTSIVDVRKLNNNEKKKFVDRVLRVTEEDNEKFYKKLRDRIDRYIFSLLSIKL